MGEAQYQALKVSATRDKIKFTVSYTIKSDNYGTNILLFLRSKKHSESAIKKCNICVKSEIWIA